MKGYCGANAHRLVSGLFPSGELTRMERLLSLFEGAGDYASVFREDAAATYWIAYHMGRGRYWCGELYYTATITSLRKQEVRFPNITAGRDDGGMSYVGTWTNGVSAGCWGGIYKRTVTTNDYVQFTTPAGVTGIGVRGLDASNGGASKVLIDGDATKATALPTAQELVDAGDLPAGVLVGGGGTLNPTDRIMDQYAAGASDVYRAHLLADDLTAGAHTVRVICTGYKNVASSDVRLYFSGIAYITASTYPGNASVNVIWRDNDEGVLTGPTSVWEYVLTINYLGAPYTFIGNGHGHDTQGGLTIYVNEVPQAVANGEAYSGSTVRVRRTSVLDCGGTDVCNVTLDYLVSPTNGLVLDADFAWIANVSIGGYMGMYPADEALLDYCQNVEGALQDDLGDDDDSVKVDAEGRMALMWQSTAHYGLAFYMPDAAATVGNRTGNVHFLWVEDRADGFDKVYNNVKTDWAWANGSTWSPEVRYLVQYFADPSASLSL